jgi:ATP-dependent RNA helicase RhlE
VEFEDLKLNKQLLNAIADLGFGMPTEIQQKAIPQIQAGHDIFGIAQTGTGKTAAYLLPILMKIKYAQGNSPRALILTPTRELAIQVNDHIKLLAKYTDLRHTAVYGGIGPKTQIETVEQGLDILVATPGRLMDIYRTGKLILKQINTLVLDEADKMMDMGFMPQIRQVLEIVPRKRQNLLFSATMPDKVMKLTEEFLEFPMKIEATPQSTPKQSIEQELYEVPNFKTKINLLQYFLDQEELHRVMIFVKTRESAENIFKFIKRKVDNEVRVIHANKGQNTRINSIEAFREGEVRILVATDVAARGIDISKVTHVFNFDVPIIYEDYVHRIGRTGRVEETGKAITFATPMEMFHIDEIEKIIKMKIPRSPLPSNITIEETPFEEKQELARELDRLRKKADPTFKGAFHEKKNAGKKKPFRRKR